MDVSGGLDAAKDALIHKTAIRPYRRMRKVMNLAKGVNTALKTPK